MVIHVFISHSWTYSEHYDKLAGWIFDETWKVNSEKIEFKNYSVPKNDPIHDADNDKQLKEAITNKIKLTHVVVLPTGMYATHSKWIKKEIDIAKCYKKPILAVNPWGQERGSGVVKEAADLLVGWNKKSVIDGIFQLYKQ